MDVSISLILSFGRYIFVSDLRHKLYGIVSIQSFLLYLFDCYEINIIIHMSKKPFKLIISSCKEKLINGDNILSL